MPVITRCRRLPQVGQATCLGCSITMAVLPIPDENRICWSISISTGEPHVAQGGVGLSIGHDWKLWWVVVCEFAFIAFAFFLEDLEATDLLCGDVAPRNTEVGRIELQFEDPLEKAASDRVRAHIIQVVEPAMRATVDGVLPGAAMRAGARRVGIVHRALMPALSARHIV